MDLISDYSTVIHFYPISFQVIVLFIIIVFLLSISGLVSASEVAFFTLDPHEMDEIKEQNDLKSKTILLLKKKAEQLLAAILILNNLVNVSIIILTSYAVTLLIDFSGSHLVEFLFQTILITFLLLLFGEIMPKIYATQNAKKVVYKVSGIYPAILKLLYPFTYILVSSTRIVNKRLLKHGYSNISVSELSHALEITSDNIDEDKDLLEGIIKFGNISVVEVMTSRVNTIDVNIQTKFRELIQGIIEYGYSRMPVYSGSHDNVKGILYIKDLLPHLDKNDNFLWQPLIRQAYFVPETKKIDDLLEEFQANKIHMAIIVDEFGGTSGIVTMEDILEEIIGEIGDEYDENSKKDFHKIDNHTFLFEAKILLHDFFRISEINEDDFAEIADDAESLAGMILELRGEIPQEKEQIEFKNYVFEIIRADSRKIEKVKLHIKDE